MSTLSIKKNYLTNNRCYKDGRTCKKIGIQIHTIGTGQGTAQSVADYWNQPAVQACVHYVCDADVPGNVLQFLPEEMRSWADAGWGNNNLISIEICESDYISYTNGANYDVNNEEKFKADILRGYNTAVLLCAKICKERGWDPLAKLGNGMYLISSHNEGRLAGLSSAHVDPDHVWGRFNLTMDGFRKAVKAAMKLRGWPVLRPEGLGQGRHPDRQLHLSRQCQKCLPIRLPRLRRQRSADLQPAGIPERPPLPHADRPRSAD